MYIEGFVGITLPLYSFTLKLKKTATVHDLARNATSLAIYHMAYETQKHPVIKTR